MICAGAFGRHETSFTCNHGTFVSGGGLWVGVGVWLSRQGWAPHCKEGATATLLRINDTDNVLSKIDVVGDKDDGRPYNRTIGTLIGPGTFRVKLKAKSDPGPFLILGSVSA